MLGRRRFLLNASSLAAAAWSFPHLPVLRAETLEPSVRRLSDDLLLVVGPDATVLAVDSDDGVILVDGGHAAWSDALARAVDEAFAAKPVGTLFNTHWHREQTGSNERLGRMGVPIIAHENTKLWLGTEVWVRWSDTRYPPLPAVARPTEIFYDSGSTVIGGRKVEYGHMPKAHTDGDIWVFFPEENVLAAGGVVANDRWPIIDWWTGGWIAGMLDGFDTLLTIANDDTRIVPGSGPVLSLAELKGQQQMYSTIFDRITEMMRKAWGTDEVLAARPTAEFDARWGDPEQFVTLAFHSLWGHLRDAHDQRFRSGA